jgi:antitoxin (DNA-binding transcriptional repressor) of toxin-antitoxin stability system
MAHYVLVHEAKNHLRQLILAALEGENVIIVHNRKPLIRLEVLSEAFTQWRRIGAARGLIVRMDEVFDEPLTDFADRMEQ